MTTTGHLSKKELQTDEVLETAATGWAWLKGHRNDVTRASLIAGAVVVIVAGAWGFVSWRKAAAGRSLSEAVSTLDAPVGSADPAGFPTAEARNAKAAELFEKTANGWGSTPAGKAAALDRAAALVAKKDTEGAWKLLEKTANGSTGLVGALAEYNLILVGPSAGKTKETIERINRLLAQTDPVIPHDVLLLTLGDIQLREGKSAEAKAAYSQLVTKYPESRLRFDAQQKMQGL